MSTAYLGDRRYFYWKRQLIATFLLTDLGEKDYNRTVAKNRGGAEMARPKMQRTKYEILQCATKLFLEKGYTDTYVSVIAKMLHISTGNLTFWFPTKEHILAELIKELCAFQAQTEEQKVEGEYASIRAYLFELVMHASNCAESSNVKDFMISAYTRPMALEIIRANDTERVKKAFGEFCPEWTETQFIQAENVASGIEYAMLMTENTEKLSFEQRVTSSLDAIMKLYEVPAEIREQIIADVMAEDYRNKARYVFEEFCNYVEEKNREKLEEEEK